MLNFSKSVPKQNHLHLEWPEGEYIFSICEWTIPLNDTTTHPASYQKLFKYLCLSTWTLITVKHLQSPKKKKKKIYRWKKSGRDFIYSLNCLFILDLRLSDYVSKWSWGDFFSPLVWWEITLTANALVSSIWSLWDMCLARMTVLGTNGLSVQFRHWSDVLHWQVLLKQHNWWRLVWICNPISVRSIYLKKERKKKSIPKKNKKMLVCAKQHATQYKKQNHIFF